MAEIVRTQNVSPITAKHQALGGDDGLLGPATGAETAITGGRQRSFSRGVIMYSRATRAKEVHGGILDKYSAMGMSGSVLGFPSTDEHDVPTGRASQFTGGTIVWSPSST